MKAVCALLCLALAQGTSASIFKRSQRPVDNLIVQPLDYINQYQQALYQPQEQTYSDFIHSQKQQQKQKQKIYQHPVSTSQESSQESNEKISKDKYVNFQSSGQKWTTPLFTAVMKAQDVVADPSPYSPGIMWSHDLQMPIQQKKQKQSTFPLEQEINKIFEEAQQVMKHPTAEEKVAFHQAFSVAAQTHNEDDHLNATELLKKYRYPVEEHTVKTDDGYILTLFHIPAKIHDVTKKPVFLMHGFLGSAIDWLLMGPGKSLAYLLSDAGYDVWLGNARGNKYSRHHMSKHPAVHDFWEFCYDDVALHDLPAMIDFVRENTSQEKLNYVGHSQGTTAMLALVSARPEYNDKIIMMHALAPTVYMKNTLSPFMRMIAPNSPFQQRLNNEIGHGEFLPHKELIANVGGLMLENEIGCKNVSSNIEFVIAGVNIDSLTPELTPVIMSHVPAGTSTRMVKQFGQQVANDEFRKYDFGPMLNEKVYGSILPPKYELENVKVPVTLYYAAEDWLSTVPDVTKLQQKLTSPTKLFKVSEPHFSHLDFQFSAKAPELVYQPLIESMNNNSS